MSTVYHKPVLVDEVLEYLNLKPGKTYVDVTFGGGGHTRAILEAEPGCTVIAIDWDRVALERNGIPLQEEFPDRLDLVWGNFAQIERLLAKINERKVDGILADFGTSQNQLTQRPGFSFNTDTPLDMRMSPAHQKTTAADILNHSSQATLVKMFKELGEVQRAHALVRLIIEEREKRPIKTTLQLVELVKKAGIMSSRPGIHPTTKVFQALRMHVNKELENIRAFLKNGLMVLNPGGRLACITFHSLEDRIVKHFFKDVAALQKPPVVLVTPKAISGSEEEIKRNPSSRSAKLRVIEVI